MKKISFLFLFIPFIIHSADSSSSSRAIRLWGPGNVQLAHLKVAKDATGKDIKRGYAKFMGDVEFCPGRSLLVDSQRCLEVKDTMNMPVGCTDLWLIPRSDDSEPYDLSLLQNIYSKKDLETLYAIGFLVGDGFNPRLFKK